jgi:hypothetical protein
MRRIASTMLLAIVASSCAPRLRPLTGTPVPARIPTGALPRERQRVVFNWQYHDETFEAKGDGVARIQPPDSARMDFFLAGGFGGGYALLIGDTLSTPGGDMVRRFLPPTALLWATLGRLTVPAVGDTIARLDGDTLRADFGKIPQWRASFVGDRLVRLERIEGGRRVESVTRGADGRLSYVHETGRRSLVLTPVRTEESSAFDPAIWRP